MFFVSIGKYMYYNQKMRYAIMTIASLLCLAHSSFAQGFPAIPPFNKNDRVLIFASHPDDEAIATAGVIQKAVAAGAKVKVVFYTNGDSNEPAFIIYEKRLTFRQGEFIHMGEVRRREALAALTHLDINESDVTFLGYPDGGTMEIMTKYWQTTKPFKSFFTRSSRVPYPGCLSSGAPYTGESILADIKNIVTGFRPNKIFVGHPADSNVDHRSLYLFLRVALWDLGDAASKAQIFPYIVHVWGWQRTPGFHPELRLEPPSGMKDISWKELTLNPAEIEKKRLAISFNKSEIEYAPQYLYSYARRNELFGDFHEIALEKNDKANPSWQEVYVPECNIAPVPGSKKKPIICALAYALQDKDLFIRFRLRRKLDRDLGISVSLFGYSRKKNFAEMPKIKVYIGILGMKIFDKKKRVLIKDAQITYEGNDLILRIPLASLGDPDRILSSARTVDLPFDQTAWRVIRID